jgi:hypothetical protein
MQTFAKEYDLRFEQVASREPRVTFYLDAFPDTDIVISSRLAFAVDRDPFEHCSCSGHFRDDQN